MYSMIMHDQRLQGQVKRMSGVIDLEVNARSPMTLILSYANYYIQRYGRIARLSIMCHGYEDKSGHGGYGLQLGRDDVVLNNVHLWSSIYRKVNWIFVYSCAAADIAPGDRGKAGDGQLLCGRLAFYTGAYVRASSATQIYNISGRTGEIDFGQWEGWVYTFAPNGAVISSQWQPYS